MQWKLTCHRDSEVQSDGMHCDNMHFLYFDLLLLDMILIAIFVITCWNAAYIPLALWATRNGTHEEAINFEGNDFLVSDPRSCTICLLQEASSG